MAGLAAADATPIQLRINGQNLAVTTDRMYGSYVAVEALDGDWADNHFPDDPDGNLYRCTDDNGPQADLGYEGTDPDSIWLYDGSTVNVDNTETRAVIGTVVLTGVLVATVFTLYVVPVAYQLLARRTGSPGAVRQRLEAEMAAGKAND
jgi:hypothetical protein